MSISPLPDDPNAEELRALLLDDGAATRLRFCNTFPTEIEALVQALLAGFQAYRRLDQKVAPDRRRATIVAFYYTALNCVLSSSQLLLAGYLAAAGHLMRHFTEATALCLLFSHPGIDAYDRLCRNHKTFPYHTALELVNRQRNRKLLSIDGDRWRAFMELASFYDPHSHASFFTVSANLLLSQTGMLGIGGEFDPAKLPAYRWELERRVQALHILVEVEPALFSHLNGEAAPQS